MSPLAVMTPVVSSTTAISTMGTHSSIIQP
jgi:hypothetical protein